MNWTWKDELESRAAQAQQAQDESDRQRVCMARFHPSRKLTMREKYQDDCIAYLKHRLRRSERWADTLLWFFLASLFGNIFQALN
jgi:hypothetical protein